MLHSQNFSTVYADIHVEACRYQLNCSIDFLKTDKNKTKISYVTKKLSTQNLVLSFDFEVFNVNFLLIKQTEKLFRISHWGITYIMDDEACSVDEAVAYFLSPTVAEFKV